MQSHSVYTNKNKVETRFISFIYRFAVYKAQLYVPVFLHKLYMNIA